MTRLLSAILFASTFATLSAQEPVATTADTAATPSAILSPAIGTLPQTLAALRPEKWKVPGNITQETQGNINSILTDLQTTLPPLVSVADLHPDSVAQVLPAFRNISALYDVLLRVSQVATLAAPAQQSAALQTAVANLERSRRQLGESLQAAALAQNQQIHDLQAQLHTPQAGSAPAAAACPPPPVATPVKKRKPRPKPTPAAAQPAPQPAAPAPH